MHIVHNCKQKDKYIVRKFPVQIRLLHEAVSVAALFLGRNVSNKYKSGICGEIS